MGSGPTILAGARILFYAKAQLMQVYPLIVKLVTNCLMKNFFPISYHSNKEEHPNKVPLGMQWMCEGAFRPFRSISLSTFAFRISMCNLFLVDSLGT